MINNTVLSLKQIALTFKNIEKPILQGIDLELKKGEFLILLGGNGSGKTSLMKIIKRQLTPNAGTLNFLNQNYLSNDSGNNSLKEIVSLTQDPSESLFVEMSVFENCLVWAQRFKPVYLKLHNHRERDFYKAYLGQFHHSLGLRLNTKVAALSGGEKQALLLALAAVYPPSLLLLDEHTAALDPHQERHIMNLSQEMIQKHQITTIMTTHNLDHALQYGDRILALKAGKIVFSAQNQDKKILTKEQLLQACY